jgi:hypothetical protein
MSDEIIKKIIEDSYDESKEEGLRSMLRDFYSRKMLSSVILVWGVGILFVGLAVYSAIHFFKTDQIQWQIMYAALFLVGVHECDVLKLFAWQMVHRNSIKREIKRLELRVAELTEALKAKH